MPPLFDELVDFRGIGIAYHAAHLNVHERKMLTLVSDNPAHGLANRFETGQLHHPLVRRRGGRIQTEIEAPDSCADQPAEEIQVHARAVRGHRNVGTRA